MASTTTPNLPAPSPAAAGIPRDATYPRLVADIGAQYMSEGFHGEVMRVAVTPADFNRYGFDLQFRMDEEATGRPVARGKTGIVFMAYLNGHQDHFTMIGGQESTRSTLHLADIFRSNHFNMRFRIALLIQRLLHRCANTCHDNLLRLFLQTFFRVSFLRLCRHRCGHDQHRHCRGDWCQTRLQITFHLFPQDFHKKRSMLGKSRIGYLPSANYHFLKTTARFRKSRLAQIIETKN